MNQREKLKFMEIYMGKSKSMDIVWILNTNNFLKSPDTTKFNSNYLTNDKII